MTTTTYAADRTALLIVDPYNDFKYPTKSFLTQCWYNTSSTSNRFAWRIPYDLMR